MTCKNSIISIKKGYQETMYQSLSYDIYHARNSPYQRKYLIHDQNMAITKNMSSTIHIIDHRLNCANVHHDIYVRLKSP